MKAGIKFMVGMFGLFMSAASVFASTNAAPRAVTLSSQERQWISEHPVLRVAVLTDWTPFSYAQRDGNLGGIDIDLLNLISQRTGLKFTLIPYKSWEQLIENWDKQDMTCSIAKSAEREKTLDFTQEYSSSPLVIVEREGEAIYGPASVLAHLRLAMPRGHITTEVVTKRLPPSSQVILTDTQEQCFDLIARKEADATAANLFVTSQYLNSHPKVKLNICGVITQSGQPLRMAVRRSLDPGLAVAILNKGLASISQDEMDAIVSKHLMFGLESRQRVGFVQTRTMQIVAVAAFVAVVLALWIYFMRREILARRKAEAELREANESLRIFSHSLSHDLRAPLRGITGFAEALRDDYREKLEGEGRRYVDIIINSGSRMDKLIGDVMAYSQTACSQWPMERIELDSLIHVIIDEFPPEQRRCFKVISKIPAVRGHVTLLTQCLWNLLSNAVRFVPPERTPEVTIRAKEEDSFVTILVEDNGIGIKPKDQQRIFKMFERASPAAFAGSGIGLAVVAKAAERMGGSVGVQSTPEKGSCFWIRLRADTDESKSPARRSRRFWRRSTLQKGQ